MIICPKCDPRYFGISELHEHDDPNTSYECQGTSVFDETGKLLSHTPCGEKWKHPKKDKSKGRKDKK